MKLKYVLAVIFLIGAVQPANGQKNGSIATEKNVIMKDSLLNVCYSLKGIPYKWGGETVKGFDCSGLVLYVFNKFGVALDHSSGEMAKAGIMVDLGDVRVGDLLIFTGTKCSDRTPGHVGIVVSNPGEPLQFIQASSSKKRGGVVITNYNESYYPVRFLQARRIADVE